MFNHAVDFCVFGVVALEGEKIFLSLDVASGGGVDIGEEDERPCEPIGVGCAVVDKLVETGFRLLVLLCVVEILSKFHGALSAIDGDVVVSQLFVVGDRLVNQSVCHVVLCSDKSCLGNFVGRDFAGAGEDF